MVNFAAVLLLSVNLNSRRITFFRLLDFFLNSAGAVSPEYQGFSFPYFFSILFFTVLAYDFSEVPSTWPVG